MKIFNLLTPTNGVDDWNFKDNEVSFFFSLQMSTATLGTRKKMLLGFFNKVFTKFVVSGSVKFSSHFKANKLKAHSINRCLYNRK